MTYNVFSGTLNPTQPIRLALLLAQMAPVMSHDVFAYTMRQRCTRFLSAPTTHQTILVAWLGLDNWGGKVRIP